MKRELNFWDYVFYISLLVILLWVILKSIGVIQTPFWLEFGIPISGLVFTTLAFYKNILDSIKEVTVGLATLNVRFNHLENEFKEFKVEVKDDISELKKK